MDLNSLPPNIIARVKEIAKNDGNSANISAADLSKAMLNDQLEKLLDELKKDGYAPKEQELVQLFQKIITDDAVDFDKKTMKAYSLSGSSMETVKLQGLDDLDEVESKLDKFPDIIKNPLRDIENNLAKDYLENKNWKKTNDLINQRINTNNSYEEDNNIIFYSASENNKSLSYLSSDWRIKRAHEAREELKKDGFKPKNPYDLQEIKEFAKKLPKSEIPEFISNYLRANFEHTGVGASYNISKDLARYTFFGNPPKLEQLPDGRRLVDCEGFATMGEILFQDLVGNSKNSSYIPIEAYGFAPSDSASDGKKTVKKGERVGHEVALMQIDGKFYMLDNDNVKAIKLSEKEKTMIDFFNNGLMSLQDFITKINKENFPSLYQYFENESIGNWGWKNVSMKWDRLDPLH